jgi:hypothetical protein
MALTLGPPTWATGSWATAAWADDSWDVTAEASATAGVRRIPHPHGRGKHAHYLQRRGSVSGSGLVFVEGGEIEFVEGGGIMPVEEA